MSLLVLVNLLGTLENVDMTWGSGRHRLRGPAGNVEVSVRGHWGLGRLPVSTLLGPMCRTCYRDPASVHDLGIRKRLLDVIHGFGSGPRINC